MVLPSDLLSTPGPLGFGLRRHPCVCLPLKQGCQLSLSFQYRGVFVSCGSACLVVSREPVFDRAVWLRSNSIHRPVEREDLFPIVLHADNRPTALVCLCHQRVAEGAGLGIEAAGELTLGVVVTHQPHQPRARSGLRSLQHPGSRRLGCPGIFRGCFRLFTELSKSGGKRIVGAEVL